MASIFTYQEEPHRVHSPWSTPGSNTPQIAVHVQGQPLGDIVGNRENCRITKLEPEKHDGPIEYKLHLLLRWRRTFTYSSTSTPAWTNQQSKLETTSALSPSTQDGVLSRSPYQPSTQSRQARLQQLTTQLLWRLQQSSPFHSSSNAKLVLPVLPEATPRLGAPDRPSKLLPGLEESQGALYEIGVADDGTLVGLADLEVEESLTNLRAMAASLGCVVDIHRRVIVGDCEWIEEGSDGQPPITRSSKLWVAEVLVRPDNKSVEVIPMDAHDALQAFDLQPDDDGTLQQQESPREHLRVALVGASAAGKSSLLGTLTTSVLDNGRGKSRLSLLKHRHEIASGITSSVAQELLGYRYTNSSSVTVVNYATGNVSSWPDVHNLADRLVFLSDSPGLPRYAKSTFRAMISWDPAWTVLCIPADDPVQDPLQGSTTDVPTARIGPGQIDTDPSLSMAHLDLCLKLGRPFLVAITKMDVATKSSLRNLLAQILSIVKAAGKIPLLMNTPAPQSLRKDDIDFSAILDELVNEEQSQIVNKMSRFSDEDFTRAVPIVMTSSLSGLGIANFHALMRSLPFAANNQEQSGPTSECRIVFRIDEVFAIPPSKVYSKTIERAAIDSGVVLCGVLQSGTLALSDELLLGPFLVEAEAGESLQARTLRRASLHQSKSLSQSMPRSLSENFSRSLQFNGRQQSEQQEVEAKVSFVKVRVVSLRNLRLPVSTLIAGGTGTVGIQPVEAADMPPVPLNKARKGMVLTSSKAQPQGYRTFTASFPYSDFNGSASPPLILGGHAIAYIHSIRTTVRVTAVALEDESNQQHNDVVQREHRPHDEVFSFDEDDDENGAQANDIGGPSSGIRNGNLKITFKFISTVEFVEVNDQVLVVPHTTHAGPVTGAASTSTIPGFSGFVGQICEVQT